MSAFRQTRFNPPPAPEVSATDPEKMVHIEKPHATSFTQQVIHLHSTCSVQRVALSYFLGAFFLPATVLRFPLRVRLLVLVRWPLTGRPLR